MKSELIEKTTGFLQIKGKLDCEDLVITTDSRKLDGFNCFLAMRGDRVDSHRFVESVVDKGIKYFIVEKDAIDVDKLQATYQQICLIVVDNSVLYLQELAKNWISDWKNEGGIALGLTGSNGKTTTKEMIKSLAQGVLGKEYVSATKGNFNNQIGVPLTILQEIKKHTKFAIIEMGISHPGDMDLLCEIANPQWGYITNIGSAHIEFLGSKEGVFKEKAKLYETVKKSAGTFFVNTDDEYLNRLSGKDSTENIVRAKIQNQSIKEQYNLENLSAATYIVSSILGCEQKVQKAAEDYKTPEMNRSQWLEKGGANIFLDAYNANPDSMLASVNSFTKERELNECFFVLGDMNELGKSADAEHEKIGAHLRVLGVKNVAFIGRYVMSYKKGYGENSLCYKDVDDFRDEFQKVLISYKFIFLKASRSLQLESLLDIT